MNRLFTPDHGILLLCWIFYCALHSVLAAGRCKQWIQQKTGAGFRYYRLGYSVFATITLAALLWYHFSFPSVPSLLNGKLIDFAGILLTVTGATIMCSCIYKYFFNLSGIAVFFKRETDSITRLEKEGLHRYTRHPLYFGTLLFSWGLFLLMPYPQHLIANVVMTAYIVIAIRWEEKKLLAEFGPAYKEYAAKVPRLLPWKM